MDIMVNDIEKQVAEISVEIERGSASSSSYKRLDEVCDMFRGFACFYPTPLDDLEELDIIPPSFDECLELVSEFLGSDERERLCRAINKLVAKMLQPEL